MGLLSFAEYIAIQYNTLQCLFLCPYLRIKLRNLRDAAFVARFCLIISNAAWVTGKFRDRKVL